MEGVKLEQHYRDTRKKLAEAGGMLGLIFRKAQNKIQDPAKLRQLIVELIGKPSFPPAPRLRAHVRRLPLRLRRGSGAMLH
jgi:hypothetical protein